jgi:two-component system CheB/CheR fusion protein
MNKPHKAPVGSNARFPGVGMSASSNEELQSLNEALFNINAELKSKIEELERTNNDLKNIFSSTDIPTLFLDRQFNVRRFSPAMTKLAPIVPSDIGRPLGDISIAHLGDDLLADARTVLDRAVPVTGEISIDSAWCVRRTLPYRTSNNRIEGAVITFTDITNRKAAEEKIAYQSHLLANVHDAAIGLDSDFVITYWNNAAEQMYGWKGGEAIGRKSFELLQTVYVGATMEEVAGKLAREGRMAFEALHRTKEGRQLIVDVHSAVVLDLNGKPTGFISTCRDLTERKRAEEYLRETKAGLSHF